MKLPLSFRPVQLAYGAAAIVAAASTVAGARLLESGSRADLATSRGTAPLRAYATLSDRQAFFGDDVNARLEIVFDRARIEPSTLRVTARFGPYAVAGVERTDESLGAGYARRVYSYRLRCLEPGCLPRASAYRVFHFPPVRVAGPGRARAVAAWPLLAIVSRTISGTSIRAAGLRTPAVGPRSTDRSRPYLFGLAALLTAAALALGGFWIVRTREDDPRSHAVDEPPDPVAAAADVVRVRLVGAAWARQRGALDRLARALADVGEHGLAATASNLAWRRRRPADTEVERLLEEVGEHRAAAGVEEPRREAA